MVSDSDDNTIREAVRKRYAEVAKTGSSCCGGSPPCCGSEQEPAKASLALGYSPEDLGSVPDGADLGLGCGNPHLLAALREGETVLDLGSGAGFDCFLAAKAVGPTGRVIGVDMTPEMIARARENAKRGNYENVEFRLGEIEHLPVADETVDVIVSNCVINLSPDKRAVFQEAYRVLKPGGRLAISDIVATRPLPPEWKDDLSLLSGCISGAATTTELENLLTEAGFTDISIRLKEESREFISAWQPGTGLEDYVVSAEIWAVKPRVQQA